MLSLLRKPARESIFEELYFPRLVKSGVDNVVLRQITTVSRGPVNGYEVGKYDTAKLIFTPLSEVSNRVERFCTKRELDSALALTSLVSADAIVQYLLLVDFGLSVNNHNQKELVRVLQDARWVLPAFHGGLVLRTTNSYHAIWFNPLSKEEWERHMNNVSLLRTRRGEEIVDVSYMDTSLRRGYGALRITNTKGKGVPELVCNL